MINPSRNNDVQAGAPGADAPPSVPDHQLLRRIGRGSYGEVWLAQNTIGSYRAVKVLHRRTFESDRPYDREFNGIKRFEPVSRSHEGLVDILQVGRNDRERYFYYVMELADDALSGSEFAPDSYRPRSLDDELIRRGRMPFNECLQLGVTLSSALNHLHRQGLVHRDIKPSNVIFIHGVPKIADIGLVTEVGSAHTFVGTEGFIPPEGPGTPQADIYSLGKVLYEASTGKDRQQFPALPTNLEERPELQDFLELNEVILKACDTQLRSRYQTAEDMHADLVLLQAGKSVKRLRVLEQRLSFFTKLGAVSAVLLFLFGAIAYQVNRERSRQAEDRQRRVGQTVAYGTRNLDAGDLLGSLPWFAEALMLDAGDPAREAPHRMRLQSILQQSPRIVHVFFGDSPINYAAISPGGHQAVTAGSDGVAAVWDIASGRRVSRLTGHTDEIETASFSPDGGSVLTASIDKTARIFRVSTGECLRSLNHPDKLYSAYFDRAGGRILTACADGKARIWPLEGTGPPQVLAHHTDRVRHAAFSPDGLQVVTASQDSTACLWEIRERPVLAGSLPHGSWVYHAEFSPDSQYVVTAAYDFQACLWSTRTRQKILSLKHTAPVYSAKFSPDGRYVVTACWDYSARVWDVIKGEQIGPALKHSGNILQASFSPDGTQIITAARDRMARVWTLATPDLARASANTWFSQDGTNSLAIRDGVLRIQSPGATGSIGSSGLTLPGQFPGQVTRVVMNRTGSRALVVTEAKPSDSRQMRAQLWDLIAAKPLGRPFDVGMSPRNALLSEDGKRFISVGSSHIRGWDTLKGEALPWSVTNQSAIASLSGDGEWLATTREDTVFLRDASTGRAIHELKHSRPVSHVDFSRNSSLLVTTCKDGGLTELYAQLWEVPTGQPTTPRLSHRDGVWHASFRPDGRWVATASEDRTAQIWDTTSGQPVGRPLLHGDEVFSVSFSSDGRWLTTACRDGSARLWDSQTQEPLTPPLRQPESWAQVKWRAISVMNGQGILTEASAKDRFAYSLKPDPRPIEDLRKLANFLAGHHASPTIATSPVTRTQLQQSWRHLRAQYPAEFMVSSNAVISWHQREAQASERMRLWSAALFHWDRIVAAHPEDAYFAERRARVLAELAK